MSKIKTQKPVPYGPDNASKPDLDTDLIDRAIANIAAACGPRGTKVFSDPHTARSFFVLRLSGETREHFECAFLDTRHRLIAVERLFSGTIDSASVYPREVLKRALELNAAALILAHNHPSGTTDPSTADERLTQRIKDACALIDLRVLDHIVVAGAESLSFSEAGL